MRLALGLVESMAGNVCDAKSLAHMQDSLFDEECPIVIALSLAGGGNKVQIECGDGVLEVKTDGEGLLEVSDSPDRFMNSISTRMKEWASSNKVTDLEAWMKQFKMTALEQYATENPERDGSPCTDNDYWEEDNDGGPMRDAGLPRAEFMAEREMKMRWKFKEEALRRSRAETGIARQESNSSDSSFELHGRRKVEKVQSIFSPGASSIALSNDLWQLIQSGSESGYEVAAVDDNIYCWTVKMSHFSEDSPLMYDLARLDDIYGYATIELQFQFAMVSRCSAWWSHFYLSSLLPLRQST